MKDRGWLIYLLACEDKTLYCGITNDLDKRLKAHARGTVKYTRGRLPVRVVHTEPADSKSDALKREAAWKRLSRAQKLRRIGVVALALFGACGGASTPKFSDINREILQPSCAQFSVCHSDDGASSANGLNMSHDPYAMLVNVPAVNAQAASEGRVRVKPGDPESSFLYMKITLPLTPSAHVYGDRMPSGGNDPLPDDQIAKIHDWIAAGAAED